MTTTTRQCAGCGRALDDREDLWFCDGCRTLAASPPPWPEGVVTVRDYPSMRITEVWRDNERIA